MSTRFLTAHWRYVCLLTYACPPELLVSRCPPGTELELVDGQAHVSLVALDFLQTRVLGVSWPGFRNFPEINLRFYVRAGDRRGVVFIREYVPSPFVAWFARSLYNEPYRAAPMASRVVEGRGALLVKHELRVDESRNTLRVLADNTSRMPSPDSLEHRFKEHQWGFGKDRNGNQVTYEVRHPHWEVFRVRELTLSWDWKDVYGEEWAFLQKAQPVSVILAAGSGIEVYWCGAA